jgi:hypothetical protein
MVNTETVRTAQAHSMCVTLRIDPATLHSVEQERGDKTLSATMNACICGALSVLVSKAKEGESDALR